MEDKKQTNKKKDYIPPEIKIIEFETKDVITTSGIATGGGDNEAKAPSGWWN